MSACQEKCTFQANSMLTNKARKGKGTEKFQDLGPDEFLGSLTFCQRIPATANDPLSFTTSTQPQQLASQK
jgi:hypothetical protein